MQDLKERIRDYALRVIDTFEAVPRRGAGRVIADQMLRSGTSVGAHYREGIRSRSAAEYASKLTAGLMELEETEYWLELLEHRRLIRPTLALELYDESEQIKAILIALIKRSKR